MQETIEAIRYEIMHIKNAGDWLIQSERAHLELAVVQHNVKRLRRKVEITRKL